MFTTLFRNPNSPYILVGGENGIVVLNESLDIIYDMKTEFETANAFFSPDD
jgi:hypothetical protein